VAGAAQPKGCFVVAYLNAETTRNVVLGKVEIERVRAALRRDSKV
jgi:hypothetical protein